MLNNKRGGFLTSSMGRIILLLIGLGVVSFSVFYVMLPKLLDEKTPETLCRSTVTIRAATSEAAWGVSATPIACQTFQHEIKGDREELKAQMAQLMSKCWWQFNEGRQDNVMKGNWEKFFGWSDQENACFVCYDVAIDQDEIEGGPITAPEMFDYMVTSEHYKIDGLTNIDYVQSYGGAGKIAIMSPVSADNRFGIVYLPRNANDASYTWVDASITALSTAGIAACIIAQPCGLALAAGAVAGGAGVGYLGAHTADIIEHQIKLYTKPRDVSMVALDGLNTLQKDAKCKIVRIEN
jgi:hypothetical protein